MNYFNKLATILSDVAEDATKSAGLGFSLQEKLLTCVGYLALISLCVFGFNFGVEADIFLLSFISMGLMIPLTGLFVGVVFLSKKS